MYNIHDFLARKFYIVFNTYEEYVLATKWFKKYNLQYDGDFLDEVFDYPTLRNIAFCINELQNKTLGDIVCSRKNAALDVGRCGQYVSINDVDFSENRLFIADKEKHENPRIIVHTGFCF